MCEKLGKDRPEIAHLVDKAHTLDADLRRFLRGFTQM